MHRKVQKVKGKSRPQGKRKKAKGKSVAWASVFFLLPFAFYLLPSASSGAPTTHPAMRLGVNLDANVDGLGSGQWVNVCHAATGWYAAAGEAVKGFDANGFPLSHALCHIDLRGYPAGEYSVAFTGGNLTIRGHPLTNVKAQGTSSLGVVTLAAGEYLILESDGGVRSLRILCPGYGQLAQPSFTPDWVAGLKPFRCLRVMDWQMINVTTPQHFSDLPKLTDFDQTSRGVAIDFCINAANAAGCDLWVCIHDTLDDDGARAVADAMKQLRGHIHVEYSNELWNTDFPQSKRLYALSTDPKRCLLWDGYIDQAGMIVHYADAQGNVILGTDGRTRAARIAAGRAAHVGQIFRNELGPAKVSVVFAAQCMAPDWASSGLEWIDASRGGAQAAQGGFDELAIAPYLPLPGFADLVNDGLWACENKFIDGPLAAAIESHRQLAAKYHLRLVAYEGGQSWFPLNGGDVDHDSITAAQWDARMKDLYAHLLGVCAAHEMELFCHDSYRAAEYSKWGYWPLVVGAKNTPKYGALAAWPQ